MTHTKRSVDEHLDEWLRDAHAMEEQAGTMLAAMARRLERYPALKARIEQHLRETQEHARMIRECVGRRGSDVSALRDFGARSLAALQAFTAMFSSDEPVKNAISCFAFENFQVAAYRTLIATARSAGDAATLTVCERILPEEIAMAHWLEQHLPEIVNAYLARAGEGAPAQP
ncbi:ferritin-like domain-containing protein [Burkholderia sp. Ac-20379]|uniref:ferritin-like domain-containing protein n=1 Tax=Burkholderia sp. Ac-20379 TaxID=2703900 RepID=UPI00197E1468|nr:ferritin-like domain-containing protein [Burkholderia sp. Ac-20379]MBN3723920.1 ferritin-like domain-containing protein [Burkholderia sp. Ac-20379]